MLRRIHTFTGLLTLVNLTLYAVVGIAAFFHASAAPAVVWEREFTVRAGQNDREVADRVVRLLGLSLATPVHDFAIGHDAEHRLVLDFYHANGRHKVTVLGLPPEPQAPASGLAVAPNLAVTPREHPGRLRVEQTRATAWQYLSTLHVTTAAFHSGDWRMQLWAWWNEFAMWCLAVMAASGVGICWQRRGTWGRLRRTHRYTALGALALIAAYEVSAVQMTHRTWLKAGTVLGVLNRIHRMRGAGLSLLLGIALLVLGATGLWLWWTQHRDRRLGAVMIGLGLFVAGGLIWWMRVEMAPPFGF